MNTKLRFFALATVGSMAAFAGLVACGDDDSGGTTTPLDSGTDTSVVKDTGTPDVIDAGADVFVEPPDAAAVLSFRSQIDQALCSTLTRCCFNDGNLADGGAVTGGHYNQAQCLGRIADPLGFEGSNIGADNVDQTKLALDQAKVVDCISKINALSCDLPGAELAAARASCFAAIVGTTPNGQACTASMACQAGSYCKPAETDGSIVGTCAPLAGLNGLCGTFPFVGDKGTDPEIANAKLSEEACSTRAGGDTNLHCNSYDPNLVTDESVPPTDPTYNPNGYRPRSEWKCVATETIGTACNSTVWCSDGICDPTNFDFVCKTPLQYFQTSGACTAVVTP